MYVKIDGQLKTIKRVELTSDSKTILLHIQTETGKRCIIAIQDLLIIIICAHYFPQKSIFQATLLAETRILVFR